MSKIKNLLSSRKPLRLRAESGPSNDIFVDEKTLVVHLTRETLLALANDPTTVWVAPAEGKEVDQICIIGDSTE